MSLKKYSFLKTSCPELFKLNSQEDGHPCFSRMRSEGFPFIVWGSGGWTLVRLEWLVASSSGRRVVVGSASRRRRVVNSVSMGEAAKPLLFEGFQAVGKREYPTKGKTVRTCQSKWPTRNCRQKEKGQRRSRHPWSRIQLCASGSLILECRNGIPAEEQESRKTISGARESTDCKGIQLRSP